METNGLRFVRQPALLAALWFPMMWVLQAHAADPIWYFTSRVTPGQGLRGFPVHSFIF